MKLQRKAGQAMTEYVIIIAVVAIAALLVVGIFGSNIRNLFAGADKSLSAGQAQQAEMQGNNVSTDKEVRVNDYAD